MLAMKTIRKFFPRRTPVEFDIMQPDAGEPQITALTFADAPDAADSPNSIDTLANGMSETLDAVQSSLTSLSSTIEPTARRISTQLESIVGSERQLGELVGRLVQDSAKRENQLGSQLESLGTATDRQTQVLSAIQRELDRSQSTQEQLNLGIGTLREGITELVTAQTRTAERTEALLDTARAQVEEVTRYQNRFFGLAVAVLSVSTLTLLVAMILVFAA